MGKTIVILLLSLIGIGVAAQPAWVLKKDEDGIKVFTAATANSDFKTVKVECTVKATLTQLVAFLMDVDKQHDWVYNNKSSKLVKKISDHEMIFYAEVSVPWPCTNRDYISHITVTQTAPQLVIIDAHTEPGLIPLKEGDIRVKQSGAHWELTALNSDLVRIVYTVQFDPSGSVPAWLTNMFMTKGPYETFQKLRVGVNDLKYRQAHLDYIKD